jgi:hypothetical protein
MEKILKVAGKIAQEVIGLVIIASMIVACIVLSINTTAKVHAKDKYDDSKVDSDSSYEIGISSDDYLERQDLEFLIRRGSPLVNMLIEEDQMSSETSDYSAEEESSSCQVMPADGLPDLEYGSPVSDLVANEHSSQPILPTQTFELK